MYCYLFYQLLFFKLILSIRYFLFIFNYLYYKGITYIITIESNK